jgi:hypothetical protein
MEYLGLTLNSHRTFGTHFNRLMESTVFDGRGYGKRLGACCLDWADREEDCADYMLGGAIKDPLWGSHDLDENF